MHITLEDHDPRLRKIHHVSGEGNYVSFFSSNVYSIGNKSITLIDAGDETETFVWLISALQKLDLNVRNITTAIITHSHEDHWGGLTSLLQTTALNIFVYKEDVPYYQKELSHLRESNEYSILGLADGDLIEAEGRKLRVLHTPGHDSGSICLYDEDNKILFSGDTVFSSGTTGSLRSGNITDLKQSLKRLTTIDVDILLPGHGSIVFDKANEVIALALERKTRDAQVSDGAPY